MISRFLGNPIALFIYCNNHRFSAANTDVHFLSVYIWTGFTQHILIEHALFLHKNSADMKKSSCFRATSSIGLSQTISNWMQQSSSCEVNTRPATQEQRVLLKPNFRHFNVLTTFRHWDLTLGILMGFTPSHPVSYISILPATSTYSRRFLQIF